MSSARLIPYLILYMNYEQCEARTGHFGPGITVLCVDLEDDPDERKDFDCGYLARASERASQRDRNRDRGRGRGRGRGRRVSDSDNSNGESVE